MNQEHINKTKIKYEVENALIKNKAKNVKAVSALIDYDLIKNTDNGLSGLDEQIENLKTDEKTAFLFESNNDAKNQKIVGAKAEEGKIKNKHKNQRNLTYTEMCKEFLN